MVRFLNKLLRGCFLPAGRPCSLPGTVGTSRRASPKGAFKPQFEALERREVMSAVTTGVLAAPPTSILANVGSVLANQGIAPQSTGSVSNIAFNGNTAVDVVSTPTALGRPTQTTVQTLNIKDELLTLYQQNLPTTTKAISDYLSNPANTAGYHLYDINLNLGYADPRDLLLLSVDSTHDSFTLTYTQEEYSSYLDCKINESVFGFLNPSMNVSFHLQMVMNFTTSGAPGNPADGPVALQSAAIRFTDPIVHLNGPFVSNSDVTKAQNAFNNAQGDATAILNQDLATDLLLLNSQLLSYFPQAVVTPSFDTTSAQFDLLVSSGAPSTAPHAAALAQPSGTFQNNQQIAFQADPAQPGTVQALDHAIRLNELTIKKTTDNASPAFFKNA